MRRISDWCRRWKAREWWFSVFWLWGLAPGLSALPQHHSAPTIALAAAGAAVFSAAFVVTVANGTRHSNPRLRLACYTVTATLAIVYPLLLGPSWLAMFIYAAICNANAFPMRRAATTAVPLVAAQWAVAVATGSPFADYWPWLASTAVSASFSILGVERSRTKARLRQGEEAMAQLAVNEERLRFGRDLHDLLGHSLSLLSLKAQLAERMVHTDPDACAKQIAEMREITSTALAEVRESVTGYRRPTLATELARAHTTLTTAGIHPEIDPGLEPHAKTLAPAREAALAWALRESVTNVVRHSSTARTCHISLTRSDDGYTLTVQNDGPTTPTAAPTFGNGLSGLRERLALEDGHLDAAPTPHGFRVRAHLPHPPRPEGDGRVTAGGQSTDGQAAVGARRRPPTGRG
ncbi:sensor histidine kinase [Peterkaempfera bronchialis]|uniref:Sensor histidine kinase n=1 Tax=Peterkaempfera bronchialis TaxID=2126346 RepID=A0A345SVF7_9ACTN|nr:sensor histidine kinase [Peterkaempfera bronchialis]AXI77712.1 sensor histidine kinase [Peterkaempfera bronchialis]